MISGYLITNVRNLGECDEPYHEYEGNRSAECGGGNSTSVSVDGELECEASCSISPFFLAVEAGQNRSKSTWIPACRCRPSFIAIEVKGKAQMCDAGED